MIFRYETTYIIYKHVFFAAIHLMTLFILIFCHDWGTVTDNNYYYYYYYYYYYIPYHYFYYN